MASRNPLLITFHISLSSDLRFPPPYPSPSKRKLLSDHLVAVSPKKHKLSPHTQNSTPDPNLHQRLLQSFMEPPSEESVPITSSRKYTPLEQQVLELKSKYLDVILMVEIGYRYTEDIRGGCVGEEGFGSQSNFLVCVVDERVNTEATGCGLEVSFDVRVGIVGVEISTSEVFHGEFNDNFMRCGLEAVILSLSPAELFLGQPLSQQTEKFLLPHVGPTSNVRVERASLDRFGNGSAVDEIISLYEDLGARKLADNKENKVEVSEEGLSVHTIMSMPHLTVQALALTLCHLKQFGFESIICFCLYSTL